MKKFVAIAASLLFVATVYAAGFPDITISDLKSAMSSQKVILLDANGTETWQSGHIPGAIDFAANSARFSASGVDTSGLGAPFRTAMPMPVRATSIRPGRTLPC